jgi:hypothetical protein
MVQDAVNRVVPSILFFPECYDINELTKFIASSLENSPNFVNDMNILGTFQNKYELPFEPCKGDIGQGKDKGIGESIIFDGAAIGQYLGGVDIKNLGGNLDKNAIKLLEFNNNTRGFINETCVMKPNKYQFNKTGVIIDNLKIPVNIPTCKVEGNARLYRVANLHIHSKQLYQFSSIFNIDYNDIITGDRVLSLCDFVILNDDIYNFHKNINNFANDIILIKDFNNINSKLLNNYFQDHCVKNNTSIVKLFVYTHILKDFTDKILPFLNSSYQYIIYAHNSDHSLNNSHNKLINSPIIKHIYAQNVDIPVNSKVTLLPIGIANSMWKHGNLIEMYSIMRDTYKEKKSRSIYVNINPSTFGYRKEILDKIKQNNKFELLSNKPYNEYLRELSEHLFCLCIRGNGIDTHRMYESLYLGVIPVLINNKHTNCNNFIGNLKKLNIPFYEINDDNLEKYDKHFFNEKLYNKIKKDNLFNLQSLKLGYYSV